MSGKRRNADDRRPKMYYVGPDDWESGLVHGKIYKVEISQMKSGRYSVEIEPEDYDLKIRRHKYADRNEFHRYWKQVNPIFEKGR